MVFYHVTLYTSGCYSTEKLVEMIAWHLDAALANSNIWKEFASCFLKLSQSEEDRMSVCFNDDKNGKKKKCLYNVVHIPSIFSNPESEYTWRLRCRWWQKRYYCQNILVLEIAAGIIPISHTHYFLKVLKTVNLVLSFIVLANVNSFETRLIIIRELFVCFASIDFSFLKSCKNLDVYLLCEIEEHDSAHSLDS